jgi:rod shape-determining protein MreC
MENFFTRYKNPLVLMAVLFVQVVALATQVKRPENPRAGGSGGGTRLIRVWTVTAFTPVEKMFVSTGHFFRDGWHNYADLRGVRRQNRELQEQVERLQMEQVRLRQDADQAHRLQGLLEFRQKFVDKTLAAQVIGTSGTEQSRVIVIDKGSRDGIKTDMAVITPDGIVGKVKDVFPLSSQVLMINDHDSGAGVILEGSRLQGVLKGTSTGELQITDIMSDEKVEPGEHVITSGGDRIFPKGLSVGMVTSTSPDRDNDPFMNVRVKPSADLRRLEEVLVIIKTAEEMPAIAAGSTSIRAADILSQRLPSIPKPDPNAAKTPDAAASPTPAKKPDGAAAPKKEGAPTAGAPTAGAPTAGAPTASATTAGTPTTGAGKPPASGAAAGKPAAGAAKPAATPGKPASSSSSSGATANGSPTPTPTPKAKAPARKTASPQPSPPENKPPEAAPSPTPERLR